jgi:signal peptidase I
MVILRWFCSKTVREATAMRRHVEKLLRAQRDLLAAPAIEAVGAGCKELREAVASTADKAVLKQQMENLEKAANKWLKPYPHAAWRENVEVLLVALAVAMAIRTFFLQPFKIPTGSMQPTLYGVTSVPDFTRLDWRQEDRAKLDSDIQAEVQVRQELQPSTGWARIREWFGGVSYVRLVAQSSGALQRVEEPLRLLIFNIKQTIWIGGVPHTLWFPPDCGQVDIATRCGLRQGQEFKRGDLVLNIKVRSGDHLFVNRLTYNFRRPRRGEIVVFETTGIAALPQDQFYIKRLVALGGERVQIGDDRHLIINGTNRLDSSTAHFENVYSFDPRKPAKESQYSGHVKLPDLAPLFQDGRDGVIVADDHYMVMGDNTMNSRDSRDWGDYPAKNVIGQSCFVYWPITDRCGWGHR